jgi:hypothetical protein
LYTGRSKFLYFSQFEPVYYHAYIATFPSASNEEQGWWVAIATHVGDTLTYIIKSKNPVMYGSAIRCSLELANCIQRLSPIVCDTVSNSLGEKMFILSNVDTTIKSKNFYNIDKDSDL